MLPLRLEDVDKASVDALISNAVREGRSIEYKLELPEDLPEKKKEFLADISSFANASGGDVLYGVDEQRDDAGKPTSIPSSAPGLAGINVDAEILRLDSIIRTGIEPRLSGSRIIPIKGFPKGPVILIRIPKSWRSPHMVTFKGTSRFYTRDSAGKHQLDVTEIRSAFALSDSLPQRVQAFRDERIAHILAEDTPVRLQASPKIILHLWPVGAMDNSSVIDPLLARDHRNTLVPIDSFGSEARLNIDGLLTYCAEPRATVCMSYLQVFRSGVFESVNAALLHTEPEDTEHWIPSFAVEHSLVKSLGTYLHELTRFEIAPPVFLMLTLTGVKGMKMAVQRPLPFGKHHPIDRDTLFLPDVAIEDLALDAHKVLKPVLDALWQAAGWPGSDNYDAQGNWKGR